MELMKQKQYSPLSVAHMAVSLYAVEHGYLDDIELEKIGDFETALLDYCDSSHKELMDKINSTGDYDDDVQSGLKSAIDDFKSNHSW